MKKEKQWSYFEFFEVQVKQAREIHCVSQIGVRIANMLKHFAGPTSYDIL